MPVDVATIMLMFPVVSLSMAAAMLVVAWGRWRDDGLAPWAAGVLMIAVAFPLFIANSLVSNQLPALMVVGNTLLAASYSASLVAICRFFGRPCSLWKILVPVVAAVVGSLVLMDRPEARVAAGGALFSLQGGMVAREALRRDNGVLERGRLLLALGVGMVIALYLQRSIGVLLGWNEVAHLGSSHFIQVGSHVMGLAGLVLTTMGFILMGRERANARHQQQALLDPLTGVPNRRALMDALERALAQAGRERRPVALLMVDIDWFKRVNDTYGHLAGDAVLVAVAQCLRGGLRGQDFIGRYGGEEFLALLPGTDASGARMVAEHLRTRVEHLAMPWASETIRVTVSIGGHARIPDDAAGAQAMVDVADQAMYAATRAGRNCTKLLDAPLPQAAGAALAAV